MSLLRLYRNDREQFWIHIMALALSGVAAAAIISRTGMLPQ